jgi:hypothetical protein
MEACEGEDGIELVASLVKDGRLRGILDWIHYFVDEKHDVVSELSLILKRDKRVEKSFPFAQVRRWIGRLAFLKKMGHFRVGDCICKNFRY